MKNAIACVERSGDLFENLPAPRAAAPAKRKLQPELTAARALCRQLRGTPSRREKQQVAHLIYLNLVSMLKRGA